MTISSTPIAPVSSTASPTAPKSAKSAAATPKAAAKAAVKATTPAKRAAPKKPAVKPVKAAAKPAKALAADSAKDTKTRKPKLVRDSFTIPKDEYAVIESLKQRCAALAQPVKKSELLRAGLKVLAGLSDSALRSAVQAVPSIKTGRPKAEVPAATKAAAASPAPSQGRATTSKPAAKGIKPSRK
jgi:hypothetical protein